MLDSCMRLSKKNKGVAFALDELDDPLSRLLEGVEIQDKVSKLMPEIMKHVPRQLAFDLIQLVDGTPIDEIEDTYKIEGFNAWYLEKYAGSVEPV